MATCRGSTKSSNFELPGQGHCTARQPFLQLAFLQLGVGCLGQFFDKHHMLGRFGAAEPAVTKIDKRLHRHINKVDVKAVEENSSGIGSIM